MSEQNNSDPFRGVVDDAYKSYPKLGRIMSQSVIDYADPKPGQTGNSLEFYPPWERDNPHFGRPYLEVYDRNLKGTDLRELLAADTLHYLGSVDPRGMPVDPAWLSMKKKFQSSMSPEQTKINQDAYKEDQKRYGENRPFDQWMQESRVDAFLRGGLFPRVNPEWQKDGTFTPEQHDLLQQMQKYISQ